MPINMMQFYIQLLIFINIDIACVIIRGILFVTIIVTFIIVISIVIIISKSLSLLSYLHVLSAVYYSSILSLTLFNRSKLNLSFTLITVAIM